MDNYNYFVNSDSGSTRIIKDENVSIYFCSRDSCNHLKSTNSEGSLKVIVIAV